MPYVSSYLTKMNFHYDQFKKEKIEIKNDLAHFEFQKTNLLLIT